MIDRRKVQLALFDAARVAGAMAEGLSVICASCVKYWEARDRRIPDHRCLSKDGCASPIGGGDFHEYEGPIAGFDEFCFVCGEPPKFVVRSKETVRAFGMCEKHLPLLKKLQPAQRHAPVRSDIKGLNGLSADALLAPKKSLARAIHEVETYYAGKKGEQ